MSTHRPLTKGTSDKALRGLREVYLLLERICRNGTYSNGFNDAVVAQQTGVSSIVVARIRRSLYTREGEPEIRALREEVRHLGSEMSALMSLANSLSGKIGGVAKQLATFIDSEIIPADQALEILSLHAQGLRMKAISAQLEVPLTRVERVILNASDGGDPA